LFWATPWAAWSSDDSGGLGIGRGAIESGIEKLGSDLRGCLDMGSSFGLDGHAASGAGLWALHLSRDLPGKVRFVAVLFIGPLAFDDHLSELQPLIVDVVVFPGCLVLILLKTDGLLAIQPEGNAVLSISNCIPAGRRVALADSKRGCEAILSRPRRKLAEVRLAAFVNVIDDHYLKIG
jgi:hypothetical protein